MKPADNITTFGMEADSGLRLELDIVRTGGTDEWQLIISSEATTSAFDLTVNDVAQLWAMLSRALEDIRE